MSLNGLDTCLDTFTLRPRVAPDELLAKQAPRGSAFRVPLFFSPPSPRLVGSDKTKYKMSDTSSGKKDSVTRSDTLDNLSLEGKSVSNKERFDKLKESRQKYKDEADAAKKRCARLEEHIQNVQAQQARGGSASAASPGEVADLRLKLKVAQEMVRRLEQQVESGQASLAKCEASLREATEEVMRLRQSAAKAAGAGAGAGAGVWGAGDDFSTYVQGAVVGAGMVALVGYAALSFAVKN